MGRPFLANWIVGRCAADRFVSLEEPSLSHYFTRPQVIAHDLPAQWKAFFGQQSQIISFLADPDHCFQKNVRESFDGDWSEASPHPACAPAAKHFLRAGGFDPASDFTSKISPLPEDKERGIGLAEKLGFDGELVIHPGSGGKQKNWDIARWAETARWIHRRTGRKILFLMGEAEEDEHTFLISQKNAPWILRRSGNMPDTLALLAVAKRFMGHDSGISHLAAALGIKSLVLFGQTSPEIWAPQGDHVRVLKKEAMGDHSTVEVCQSVEDYFLSH